MKKYILLTILICIAIVVLSSLLLMNSSKDKEEIKLATISSNIFQATLSGCITFAGLFLTVLSQEQQQKNIQTKELMPCFILKATTIAGPKSGKENILGNNKIINCSNSEELRTIECEITNAKDNYAINVGLVNANDCIFLIGSLGSDKQQLLLALDSLAEGTIIVVFEDVYGHKYKQHITYKYDEGKNKYVFTSCQPKRRTKKDDKKYK